MTYIVLKAPLNSNQPTNQPLRIASGKRSRMLTAKISNLN